MADKSRIEWTQHTWNPVVGCTEVSPGCDHCYARQITERFGPRTYPRGFAVTLKPHRLRDPKRWKEPALVFVNSMSDLFHRHVPDDYLRQVWDVMLTEHQHIYQILTKRPHRMEHKLRSLNLPLPQHIWLGVSAESQRWYDNRVEPLMRLPAAVRFVSAEPLLGPIDLRLGLLRPDWVIVGGESGPERRPMDYAWARALRDQCVPAGIPFFLKQGNSHRPGGDRSLDGVAWSQMPAGLVGTGLPRGWTVSVV